MIDRWGDFDSDVLLNAGLERDDNELLDAPAADNSTPFRGRTCDSGFKFSRRESRESSAPQSTACRRPRQYQHVDIKHTSAMFTWMLESDSLCKTLHEIMTPLWLAMQANVKGTSLLLAPENMDLISQRLAKRYGNILLPSHGIDKARRMDPTEFFKIVTNMITPAITYSTIPECFDAVRSMTEQLVYQTPTSWLFRDLKDIETIHKESSLPQLNPNVLYTSSSYTLPAANQSLVLNDSTRILRSASSSSSLRLVREMAEEAKVAREEQIKQKLRLRKYWSTQASDTAALILPDEIPLFHREDLQSRAKSRESLQTMDSPMEVNLQHGLLDENHPPSRSRDDSKRGRLSCNHLKSNHHEPESTLELTESNLDNMALICTKCNDHEAVLWCSQCFTIYCHPCWTIDHTTSAPSIAVAHTTGPYQECVRTQRIGRELSGPPLPLLQTPPLMSTKAKGTRLKPKQYIAAPAQSKSREIQEIYVANTLAHAMSMPSLAPSDHPPRVMVDLPPAIIRSKPSPHPWGRIVLKQHSVDLLDMLGDVKSGEKR